MGILGIHHVALVSSDAGRTIDYYTRVLGLRLVLQSRDVAERSVLYFGNHHATPGSIISVAEQAGVEAGREGVGGTHHFALLVETRDGLLQWKRWLTDQGIAVNGPLDRHYFESIYHRDPDGQVIEIATRGAGWTRDEAPDRIGTEHRPPPPEMVKGNRDVERIRTETWPEPIPAIDGVMRFQQMHHLTAIGDDIERTHAFLHGALGMRLVKRTSNFDMPDSYHWYWGIGDGEPGTVVTYFERRGAPSVRHGPGQVDHYALGVADEDALLEVRERLNAGGFAASEVRDHEYFKSFYTQDPHGQDVEIATLGPGFMVNEAGRWARQELKLRSQPEKAGSGSRPLTTEPEEEGA